MSTDDTLEQVADELISGPLFVVPEDIEFVGGHVERSSGERVIVLTFVSDSAEPLELVITESAIEEMGRDPYFTVDGSSDVDKLSVVLGSNVNELLSTRGDLAGRIEM